MHDPLQPKGVAGTLLAWGQRPIPVTRRQMLAAAAAGIGAAGIGALWQANRFAIRNEFALKVWLPTEFDREEALLLCRSGADRIRPLFARKGKPVRGEWLAYVDEPGQSLNQYVRNIPPGARELPGTISILPLGEFDTRLSRIVADVVAFAGLFYGRPVRLLQPEPVPPLTTEQRRGKGAGEQLFTDPLLEFLKRRVPKDAAALLAMTPQDLTPGPGWNFVFGMATLEDRVGVWSLFRLADGKLSPAMQLRRVAQVALHELGHMFGLWHCTAYACCMNGYNTLAEADAAPLAFCPECDAKVRWRFRLDPVKRYADLSAFAVGRGLMRDADLWARCAKAAQA